MLEAPASGNNKIRLTHQIWIYTISADHQLHVGLVRPLIMELELLGPIRPSCILVASSQALNCWEACGVVIGSRPRSAPPWFCDPTQISTDPLTLSPQLAQVWFPHPHLICLTSYPAFNPSLRNLALNCKSVRDEHSDSFLQASFLPSLSASFPSPFISRTLAFPLHGTVLLPCWGQSSLHCWRQVAKDTSTEKHSLNVMRWERWAERGERGNSSCTLWSLGSPTTH